MEYNYRFWLDDDMISMPRDDDESSPGVFKTFIFEIRTNFILKKIATTSTEEEEDRDQVLDSEILSMCFPQHDELQPPPLLFFICYRIGEYWMTRDEVDRLGLDADSFTKQAAAASGGRVVPIVVWIDVCTVRQEGETVGAARARAIRSKHLIPVHLWQPRHVTPEHLFTQRPPRLMSFLRQIERVRDVVVRWIENDHLCSSCNSPAYDPMYMLYWE